jgi:hypothetical protein
MFSKHGGTSLREMVNTSKRQLFLLLAVSSWELFSLRVSTIASIRAFLLSLVWSLFAFWRQLFFVFGKWCNFVSQKNGIFNHATLEPSTPAFLKFCYKIFLIIDSGLVFYIVCRPIYIDPSWKCDRLCGLVVRVSGYRYRGPAFDSWRYQIFWVVVGLERGPLSLVSLVRSIEELLE